MLRTAAINQVDQTNANIYLVGNPQVTFFKSVYKRHSNFAMESFNVPFLGNRRLQPAKQTVIKCQIPQYGDLLGKIYLRMDIPPMKTSDEAKFKFNKDFGYSIIENIKLKINGVIVDNIDGEMLYILNKLHNNDEKQNMVSSLINGKHTNDYLYDSTKTSTTTSTSKTFIHKHFNGPIRTNKESIYIPLDFSFTNFSKTYIPFFLLENKSIEVEVILRATNEMFTIEKHDKNYWYYDKIPGISVSGYPININTVHDARMLALDNTSISGLHYPLQYGEQTTYKSTATTPYYLKRYESRIRSTPTEPLDDIRHFTYNNKPFDLHPSLEIEQIFLTEEEKQTFKKGHNEYLIEQIHKKEKINVKGNQVMTWSVDNHTNLVKELCITIQRNDNKSRNQWLNFTNYDHADLTEENIIQYQDNWWYDAIAAADNPTTLSGNHTNVVIIPDRFQEWLFRYGPYGEAYNIKKAGDVNWPNKIEPQYKPYTMKDIEQFRQLWMYRKAKHIPKICKDNFSNVWKISPLQEMQLLFDGVYREDIKDGMYFNQIQVHKHHTHTVDPSVYMYSFSLEPEKYQPSGFCNMNLFKRIQYKMKLSNTEQLGKEPLYNYNIKIFSLKYNFITIAKEQIVARFNLAL